MKSKNQTVKDARQKPAIHTHMTREIRPIRNWAEWLERWQAAVSCEEMLGLLHVGMNVPIERCHFSEERYDEEDRIAFYFSIADGWRDQWSLELPGDGNAEYIVGHDELGNKLKKSKCAMRQVLALKAFDILCLNFFDKDLTNEREGLSIVWETTITGEKVFPVIKHFFRAEKGRHDRAITVRNLPGTDHAQYRKVSRDGQAVKFLLNLATYVLDWKEESHEFCNPEEQKAIAEENAQKRAAIEGARPWIIEVLFGLNRLDLLGKRLVNLDDNSVAKLKEIALRKELKQWQHPVNKDRQVKTIEEACYLNSPAAWLLTRRELILKEEERLQTIKAAEDEARKAEDLVRKLTRP